MGFWTFLEAVHNEIVIMHGTTENNVCVHPCRRVVNKERKKERMGALPQTPHMQWNSMNPWQTQICIQRGRVHASDDKMLDQEVMV